MNDDEAEEEEESMKALKGIFPVIFFFSAVLIAAGIPAEDDTGRAVTPKKTFIVRNDTEGPRVMAEGGLMDLLRKEGFEAAAVSVPVGDHDPEGLSLKAAYRLIEGALRGYGSR